MVLLISATATPNPNPTPVLPSGDRETNTILQLGSQHLQGQGSGVLRL